MRSQRGQTSAEYMGILLIVATIIGALFVSGIGDRITQGVETAICRIVGGDCEQQTRAAAPERCLQGRTTNSSSANVLIAVVRVDKDSTLIREDYSDGTSRFTILDNSEVAGEVFAGVKGKVANYGLDYSASADAGLKLAGARVFELPDPAAADAFQEKVQAAGGFDGILRDVAAVNDKIPLIGVDNPLGGVDDWALDQLGVDDNEDLPTPTETYVEAGVFLEGKAEAGGGVGIADAQIKGLIKGAGVVKVTTSGANEGDVEVSFELEAEAAASLTAATLGPGANGKGKVTATLKLDAQNGYRPDELEMKASAGYTGSFNSELDLKGDDLAEISKALEKVALSGNAGEGQGIEFGAKLDLDDPQNLAAALGVLGQASNPAAVAALGARFDEAGELSLDTYNLSQEETEGEIKVGLGIGGGAGGSSSTESQSGRSGSVRAPGGTFQPRVCKQPA